MNKHLARGIASISLVTLLTTPSFAMSKGAQDRVMADVLKYKDVITVNSKEVSRKELLEYLQKSGFYNINGVKLSETGGQIRAYISYFETLEDSRATKRLASLIASEVQSEKIEVKIYHAVQRISELLRYSDENPDNPTIFSPSAVNKGGVGVCQAYARLGEAVFTAMGIENSYIEGSINGTPHLWNAVKASNGEWYSVDITSADDDESNKINFQFVLVPKDQLKEIGYSISSTKANLSNRKIQEFDGTGLFSKLHKKFYSYMVDGSDTIYSYSVTDKRLDIEQYGSNFWIVGGELFINKGMDVVNTSNNEIYYKGLNDTDEVTVRDSELKVNGKTIYNSSDLPKGRVFEVSGDFKIRLKNPSKTPYFHAEETANKTNIYYSDLFLVQYIKRD